MIERYPVNRLQLPPVKCRLYDRNALKLNSGSGLKIDTGFFHRQNLILMKRGFILLISLFVAFTLPLKANTFKPRSSTDQLRREVAAFFPGRDLAFLQKNVEIVRVSFLINTKNELVICDVAGEDANACDYVKKVLNFKRINYIPAKQLTRYAVDIRLVRT